jgi:hypothetical protein
MVDEIDTEVDVREVSDFLQRWAHNERRHEVSNGEGVFLVLNESPDRLLANFLADAVADKGVLGLDGVVSGELAWQCQCEELVSGKVVVVGLQEAIQCLTWLFSSGLPRRPW